MLNSGTGFREWTMSDITRKLGRRMSLWISVLLLFGFVGRTNYSVQLHLSSVGQHSIQLVAPAGGLQIEARDVNGDDAIDLVLTTAWLKQPVAIFLNDGHGSFS